MYSIQLPIEATMFFLFLGLVLLSSVKALPSRIVNGTDAEVGEFPYVVSLQYLGGHTCGASILNEYWILTAAHCVSWLSKSDFTVQYGVTHITSDGYNTVSIDSIIPHQKFTPLNGLSNDIAVVKLAEPLVFNEYVKPILLPPAFNDTPAGAEALLAGWGLQFSGGSTAQDLQKVTIKIYSDNDCESAHALTGPSSRAFHLCAGVEGGGKGQCNGDSGSPLVVNGVQVGVVSWSVKPCTIAPYPGVFAKVSSYVDWIYEKITE